MTKYKFRVRNITSLFVRSLLCGAGVLLFGELPRALSAQGATPEPSHCVGGVVLDSSTARPIAGASVEVVDGMQVVAQAVSDAFGRFRLPVVGAAHYELVARYIGFLPAHVTGESSSTAAGCPSQRISLSSLPPRLNDLVATSAGPLPAIDLSTGDQRFAVTDFAGAPTTPTSAILQQAIAGAARAPTGEVHIRGQHAEYTYYLDGVPVPAGISGSLNELFDPAIVNQLDVQTGGWDAEYGNKNIAVVNVATRIPTGKLHLSASSYAGSFASDGETVTASTNTGRFGLFMSGTRQTTAMRRDPVMFDPATGAPINFHNTGDDLFGFFKAQYAGGLRDAVNLEANWSRTRMAIPFDSSAGIRLDDHQQDVNGFVNLGWHHLLGRAAEGPDNGRAALSGTAYFRRGTLDYTPGSTDQPQFVFYPDTTTLYNVQEDRRADTYGASLDYLRPLDRSVQLKAGISASLVDAREDFDTRDASGVEGPNVHSPVHGGDAGAYVESMAAVTSRLELRTGVRFDAHTAPLAGTQDQVSPRIRLNWRPDPLTTMWGYYGRLFVPANVEDFHVLASGAQGGAVGLPTYPERDDYFEAGYVHRFPLGVVSKFTAYHRRESPGIDDNTLPGTALATSVNIALVHVTGIETVIDVQPAGSWSGSLNAALSHASAHGPITGGFFPTSYPSGWFDQDHDQRLSLSGTVRYEVRRGFVSGTAIYGSGLTNGNPDAAPNGTSLFDFNPAVKVPPTCIVNVALGTGFIAGRVAIRPQFNVDNLFDLHYILKGAFTSGPAVGRPRSIVLRVGLSW